MTATLKLTAEGRPWLRQYQVQHLVKQEAEGQEAEEKWAVSGSWTVNPKPNSEQASTRQAK